MGAPCPSWPAKQSPGGRQGPGRESSPGARRSVPCAGARRSALRDRAAETGKAGTTGAAGPAVTAASADAPARAAAGAAARTTARAAGTAAGTPAAAATAAAAGTGARARACTAARAAPGAAAGGACRQNASPGLVLARRCTSAGKQARVQHSPVVRIVTHETAAGAGGPGARGGLAAVTPGLRLTLLGAGAMNSPRYPPAGLLARYRRQQIMLDGGPGAEPARSQPGWSATPKASCAASCARSLKPVACNHASRPSQWPTLSSNRTGLPTPATPPGVTCCAFPPRPPPGRRNSGPSPPGRREWILCSPMRLAGIAPSVSPAAPGGTWRQWKSPSRPGSTGFTSSCSPISVGLRSARWMPGNFRLSANGVGRAGPTSSRHAAQVPRRRGGRPRPPDGFAGGGFVRAGTGPGRGAGHGLPAGYGRTMPAGRCR